MKKTIIFTILLCSFLFCSNNKINADESVISEDGEAISNQLSVISEDGEAISNQLSVISEDGEVNSKENDEYNKKTKTDSALEGQNIKAQRRSPVKVQQNNNNEHKASSKELPNKKIKKRKRKRKPMNPEFRKINNKVSNLLTQKKYDEVYDLLIEQYNKGRYDNNMIFVLGIVERKKGLLDDAIEHFKELLDIANSPRVRLELGTTYFLKKDVKKAKEEFLKVKALKPPEVVGKNIDLYLDAIASGAYRDWHITATIGYVYDSNAVAGPEDDMVTMSGVPFTFGDDAKKNHDHAYTYSVSLNHMKKINNTKNWATDASLSVTTYGEWKVKSTKSISVSTGPVYRLKKNSVSIPFVVSYAQVDSEYDLGEYFSLSHGFSPQIRIELLPHMILTTTFKYEHKNYHDDNAKNIDTLGINPVIKYIFNPTTYVDFGLSLDRGHATRSVESNDSLACSILIFKALTKKMTFYNSTSYTQSWYYSSDGTYTDRRNDNVLSTSFNLSYYLEKLNSTVSCSYSYTNNDSNITTYKYDQEKVTLSLSKTF